MDAHLLDESKVSDLLSSAESRLSHKKVIRQPKGKDTQTFSHPDGSYMSTQKELLRAGPGRVDLDRDSDQHNGVRRVEAPAIEPKGKNSKEDLDAGAKWYHLPRTQLTPEMKRNHQLLHMRNVLDSHRHYKKDGGMRKVPEYSVTGTIIEGRGEYFSARLSRKDRTGNLVDEVSRVEASNNRLRNKYRDIQKAKSSGRRAFYKALQAKRVSRSR